MCRIFQKVPLSTFYILVLFSSKHPILEAFFVKRTPKLFKKKFWPKKMENLVKNTFTIWVWTSLNDWAAQNNSFKKQCIRKCYIAVKHLDPCFLTTLVKSKYLEVLLGKSDAYKSKCTLKTLLSQNMVHLTWKTKSVHMD